MSDKKIRSIAYLYNEMDPSEKLEFERDLKADENLLIEVESMRKVASKLHQMGTFQPPDEVVNVVLQRVEERKTVTGNRKSQKFVYYSAAAILMLGLTYGFVLSGDLDSVFTNDSESASIGTFQNVVPASIGNANEASETGKMMPWEDHNDVLHFQDGLYGSESASVDSIFRQSFQKLTPITSPSQSPTARQNLHLTGSQR